LDEAGDRLNDLKSDMLTATAMVDYIEEKLRKKKSDSSFELTIKTIMGHEIRMDSKASDKVSSVLSSLQLKVSDVFDGEKKKVWTLTSRSGRMASLQMQSSM
jgi:hypothetical protein